MQRYSVPPLSTSIVHDFQCGRRVVECWAFWNDCIYVYNFIMFNNWSICVSSMLPRLKLYTIRKFYFSLVEFVCSPLTNLWMTNSICNEMETEWIRWWKEYVYHEAKRLIYPQLIPYSEDVYHEAEKTNSPYSNGPGSFLTLMHSVAVCICVCFK